MGKATGFLEFLRQNEVYEAPETRVKHYKEFVFTLTGNKAKIQGTRCMDYGIPFCNNGCLVNNIIPNFNDLVYCQDWKTAIEVLHSINNFPEFMGRIRPAPCEAACTLGINEFPVGIKSIEHAIINKMQEGGRVAPQVPKHKTGKTVAVVGSGPTGMAAAQQLARAGHDVTLFEKNDHIGGLLRYGIPDSKLEKARIDRRMQQMEAGDATFHTDVMVGDRTVPAGITNDTRETIAVEDILKQFDTVVLTGGSEVPCDLPVPGRDPDGMYYALEFLIPQNKEVADDAPNPIRAGGKHATVIGGGDTGSDCMGTSNRHDAASVTQFELLPRLPEEENRPLVWSYWPVKLCTSPSHDEGCQRDWSVATRALIGENSRMTGLTAVRLKWKDGKVVEVAGSEFTLKADLVLLAMGFTDPVGGLLDALGMTKDAHNNARAATEGDNTYATSVSRVFATGDVRRGQLLVVWVIQEGRQAARSVDTFLMGHSDLSH